MRIAITAAVTTAFLLIRSPSVARASTNDTWAVSTGISELVLLGPVTGAVSTSWDVTARGCLYRAAAWAAGARLSFGPLSPELFARVGTDQRIGSWAPSLGLEVAVSGLPFIDKGDALLAELRKESRKDVVPVYLAMQAIPLRFVLWERLTISLLDLQVGTYVAPFGQFVRLQLGIVSGGLTL